MARVAGISPASVQRIWAANDIKPHLTCTFKLSNDPYSKKNSGTLSGCTLRRPIRRWCSAAMKRVRFKPCSGRSLACRWESAISVHKRMTMSVTAHSRYLPPWIICKVADYSIETQHQRQEWLAFLKKINRETPKSLQLHLIVDNYATHKHPVVKEWLKWHPRFHMHFTATSSFWTNMVDAFSGIAPFTYATAVSARHASWPVPLPRF